MPTSSTYADLSTFPQIAAVFIPGTPDLEDLVSSHILLALNIVGTCGKTSWVSGRSECSHLAYMQHGVLFERTVDWPLWVIHNYSTMR
jgi:hypothetical protein